MWSKCLAVILLTYGLHWSFSPSQGLNTGVAEKAKFFQRGLLLVFGMVLMRPIRIGC